MEMYQMKPIQNFYEETLPLEGTEAYICGVCDESFASYQHRNACDIIAKIKKWKKEGTLLDHCTIGPTSPMSAPSF